MSEWQPIETALKDDTKILVWCDIGHQIATWSEGEWFNGDVNLRSFDAMPTHWMPLPDPPALSRPNAAEEAP